MHADKPDMPEKIVPAPDKLAGDDVGSDLGPGATEPDDREALRDEQLQSPLGVAGMTPAGPVVGENAGADPGGAP